MPNVKVDSSNIPKKTYNGKVCFDWINSVNATVDFQYNNIAGTLEIVSAEKKGHGYKLTVNYEGKLSQIESSDLISGHIGNCIGVRMLNFRYAPGQRILDKKRDITILKVYHGELPYSSHKYKMLAYRCNKCGYIKENIRENSVAHGTGCPVCNGKIVKKGVNDIPSNEPWMISYFPGGVEEAELYTPNSGRHVRMICPYCGKLSDHTIAISTLHRTHSIGCPCNDGISFPEKFLFNFFQTINVVQYIRQVSAKDLAWCGRYRYDGMFRKNGELYIIEAHGIQHFEPTGNKSLAHIELYSTKENDRQKKLLANQNGISDKNYIVLDCRKSTLVYLKKSILSSPLASILELDGMEIDWEYIFVKSLAPLPRRILDYAQIHPYTSTKDIAKLFGVNSNYPAKILKAYGTYGKTEREMRRSKVHLKSSRKHLFDVIKQMLDEDPEITVFEIANRLGKCKSGIYALLRKYSHEYFIDINSLHMNAEKFRLRKLKESVCKPVHVITPNGAEYDYSSLTKACKELEAIFDIRLPTGSVSLSISQNRPIKNFVFRYVNHTD